jgi:hypothetical protein
MHRVLRSLLRKPLRLTRDVTSGSVAMEPERGRAEPPRGLVLGDWATFPPQRPGTARLAGRCVSNEQDQKCLNGSVDRSGHNIVSLGTDDRFKSLHRARAQQSDAERKARPDSWGNLPARH